MLSLITFLLSGMILMPAAVQAKMARKDWYQSFIQENTGAYRDQDQLYDHYRLLDVNRDGVKEILLAQDSRAFVDENALLLTYRNGKVKVAKRFSSPAGSWFHYNRKKNMLVWTKRAAGEMHIYGYKLSKGKLKKKLEASYYQANHNPKFENKSDTYYVNGKRSSKTAYMKYKKYMMPDTALKFNASF